MRVKNSDMKKIEIDTTIITELAKTNNRRQIAKILGICEHVVGKRLKELNIKASRKISLEGRKNISDAKRKYYKEHPEKHLWKDKNKFKSIPCEKLKEWLKSKSIAYIEEYNIPESQFNYSIDIAFPDKKIGVEVNGNQHYNYDGTLKEYYQKRHDYIESLGWKLYELHFSVCFKLNELETMIPTILNSEIKAEFNYKIYIKPKSIKTPKTDKSKKYKYPPTEELSNLLKNLSLKEISLKLNIPYSAIAAKIWRLRESGELTRNSTENCSLGENRDLQFHHKSEICHCGKSKHKYAKLCYSCNILKRRKVERPSKKQLRELIWSKPISKVKLDFNVTDTSIYDWCDYYELETPPTGYWTRRNHGYSHEESLISQKKIKNPAKRFTKEQISEIRKLIQENNLSLREIGKLFNSCHQTICKIRDKKTYKDI